MSSDNNISSSKVRNRDTILTPIQYPDEDEHNSGTNKNLSSAAVTKIVVVPSQFRDNDRLDRNPQCFWKTVLYLAVFGLFVCVVVLVYELFLKHTRAGDYIDDSWDKFKGRQPRIRASHSFSSSSSFFGFGGTPQKSPDSVSGFEREEFAQKSYNELKDINKNLDDNKLYLAKVYEENIFRFRTIFVSIAAFRDVECSMTVENIFEVAKNPRRVNLGIIEQNEHGDPTCIPEKFTKGCLERELGASPNNNNNNNNNNLYYFCPLDNIRRRRIAAFKGRGPCFGRYVSMLMYRGESYYMMLDSHNQFKPGWDADITKMLFVAESPKPVLSHYPLAWNKQKDENFERPQHVTVMCRSHFVSFGYVRMGGVNFVNSKRPRLQPFTAAGFLVADAAVIHEVPFDSHLDFLFDGEELLYSVRLYTHGWDSFSPSWNVVFHDYARHKAPRFWNIPGNEWGFHQQRSIKRVQWMLKIPKKGTDVNDLYVPDNEAGGDIRIESDKYGLGDVRALDTFWKWAKVDLLNKVDTEGVCSTYMNLKN